MAILLQSLYGRLLLKCSGTSLLVFVLLQTIDEVPQAEKFQWGFQDLLESKATQLETIGMDVRLLEAETPLYADPDFVFETLVHEG
jgi:hypothetical protein